MPFDQLHNLSAWMAEAGIDELELIGPCFRLRLDGGGLQAHDDRFSDRLSDVVSIQKPVNNVVAASDGGVIPAPPPLA